MIADRFRTLPSLLWEHYNGSPLPPWEAMELDRVAVMAITEMERAAAEDTPREVDERKYRELKAKYMEAKRRG